MKKLFSRLVKGIGSRPWFKSLRRATGKTKGGALRATRWLKRHKGGVLKFGAAVGSIGLGNWLYDQLSDASEGGTSSQYDETSSSRSYSPDSDIHGMDHEDRMDLKKAIRMAVAYLPLLENGRLDAYSQAKIVALAHYIARAGSYAPSDDISNLFLTTLHKAITLNLAGLELQEDPESATVVRDAINTSEDELGFSDVEERLLSVITFAEQGTPLKTLLS